MDWSDILRQIDEAVEPEKGDKHWAIDQLESLRDEIMMRVEALGDELSGG